MREASFILPKQNNDGESLTWLHHKLQKQICKTFGGFSAIEVTGGWSDNQGVFYSDESVRYTVAIDETGHARSELRELAKEYARKADQLALYFVDELGNVSIINL